MTEVLGVVIMRFWAVEGSSCLEKRSCTDSLTKKVMSNCMPVISS